MQNEIRNRPNRQISTVMHVNMLSCDFSCLKPCCMTLGSVELGNQKNKNSPDNHSLQCNQKQIDTFSYFCKIEKWRMFAVNF